MKMPGESLSTVLIRVVNRISREKMTGRQYTLASSNDMDVIREISESITLEMVQDALTRIRCYVPEEPGIQLEALTDRTAEDVVLLFALYFQCKKLAEEQTTCTHRMIQPLPICGERILMTCILSHLAKTAKKWSKRHNVAIPHELFIQLTDTGELMVCAVEVSSYEEMCGLDRTPFEQTIH